MDESDDALPSERRRRRGTFSLWLAGIVFVWWILGFVSALVNGEWALAAIAVILGSLSGFWFSNALSERRAQRG